MSSLFDKITGKDKLRDEIHDLTSEIDHLEARISGYKSTIRQLNEEKKSQMPYKLADMNCVMNEDTPFEVLCVASKKFVKHEGFKSYEDAHIFAQDLAAEFPGRKFVVFGPWALVQADIPVKTQKLHEPI